MLFLVFEESQIITAEVYCDQLDRLNSVLIQKFPSLINRKGIILLNNARLYSTKNESNKKYRIKVGSLIPNFSDIASSDFHFFQRIPFKENTF